MPVERFGDWGALRRLAGSPDRKISAAVRRATLRAVLLLVREIKRGIIAQAPGGQPFAPLAESTIDAKGSSKALIDTGFLLSAITQKILDDGAFIGLLRTSIGPDGQSAANIGAIMEYGATITMPNGNKIIIPKRPFLHPVMQQYRGEIEQLYLNALKGSIT